MLQLRVYGTTSGDDGRRRPHRTLFRAPVTSGSSRASRGSPSLLTADIRARGGRPGARDAGGGSAFRPTNIVLMRLDTVGLVRRARPISSSSGPTSSARRTPARERPLRLLRFDGGRGCDRRVRRRQREPGADRRRDGDQPRPAADHGRLHGSRAPRGRNWPRAESLTLLLGSPSRAGSPRRDGVPAPHRPAAPGLQPRRDPGGTDPRRGDHDHRRVRRRSRRHARRRDPGGAAIGVAISVTTIPAAAYLGVALGIGELTNRGRRSASSAGISR